MENVAGPILNSGGKSVKPKDRLRLILIICGVCIILGAGFGFYTYFYKPPPGNPKPICNLMGDVDFNVCTADGKTYYWYSAMCSCPGAGGNARNPDGSIKIDDVDCMCDRLFDASGKEISSDRDFINEKTLRCNIRYYCYDKRYESI
ncbi:MAG: hypothetical protein WCT27_04200 [Patescibacteria group bacterium]